MVKTLRATQASSAALWQMQHPARRDGLCWAPQPRPGGSALWSVWTLLADVAISKPTSLPTARGSEFFAATAAPCSPATPEGHQGGIATAAGIAQAGIQRGQHPPGQEQGHQLPLEPSAALSLFGPGAPQGLFPGYSTFHMALWSPPEGRDWSLPTKWYLPLQGLIKMSPSWTAGQSNPASTRAWEKVGFACCQPDKVPQQ